MSDSLCQVAVIMQHLLTERADALACQERFVVRQRKLSGATFAQTLVFSWLDDPATTLESMTQTASLRDVSIQPQSLDERFTESAARFLRALVEEAAGKVVAADPVVVPLLRRFNGVHLLDSTTVALPDTFADLFPGCNPGTAAVKVQVRWDLLCGALDGLELHAARRHDHAAALQQKPIAPGALRIADLGYFALDVLEALAQSEGYWLTRVQANTKVWAFGEKWDLETLLEQQGPTQVGQSCQLDAQLGGQKRLPCRLLAIRVPPEVAQQRWIRQRNEAIRRGKTLTRRQKILVHWTVLATNADLTPEEANALLGARWQIERLFRLWKEQGGLDESRSRNPYRILCEFYAKLLALLIQHWALVTTTWKHPDRSLTQAAAFFRSLARHLAMVFDTVAHIVETLNVLQRYGDSGGRLNKRRKKPNHHQKLMAA